MSILLKLGHGNKEGPQFHPLVPQSQTESPGIEAVCSTPTLGINQPPQLLRVSSICGSYRLSKATTRPLRSPNPLI